MLGWSAEWMDDGVGEEPRAITNEEFLRVLVKIEPKKAI